MPPGQTRPCEVVTDMKTRCFDFFSFSIDSVSKMLKKTSVNSNMKG